MASLIIRDELVLHHFPRTGGTWLQWLLCEHQVPHELVAPGDNPHVAISDDRHASLPRYCLYREEQSWWSSWHMFHVRTGWQYFPDVNILPGTMIEFRALCRIHQCDYASYYNRLITEPRSATVYYGQLYVFVRSVLRVYPTPEQIARRIN